MLRSLAQTVTPTLVAEDLPLFAALVNDIFQSPNLIVADDQALIDAAKAICSKRFLTASDEFIEVPLLFFSFLPSFICLLYLFYSLSL